jgi:signal transduction histidine kinase
MQSPPDWHRLVSDRACLTHPDAAPMLRLDSFVTSAPTSGRARRTILSMRPAPALPVSAAGHEPRSPAWAGFTRIFHWRSATLLALMALAHAAAGLLASVGDPSETDRLLLLGLLMRSTLISGLCVMLAAAIMEAALAARPGRPVLATPLRWLAVVIGAGLGASIRIALARQSMPALPMPWGWLMANVTVWTLLGGLASTLLMTIHAERHAQHQLLALQHQQLELQAQDLEAQLSALNAQIEPHFLFNTLAHVKRLYETAPADGRDLLGSLTTYLRAALPAMRSGEGTLGEELAQIRSYLSILQTRMGDRLSFEIDAAPDLLPARLPTMLLHTLVENSIKHGLSPLPEGGRIRIRALQSVPGQLVVEVHDNGVGFGAASGHGVGLANTRARLSGLYGAQAGLELEAASPRGLVARLRLPLRTQAARQPQGASACSVC